MFTCAALSRPLRSEIEARGAEVLFAEIVR